MFMSKNHSIINKTVLKWRKNKKKLDTNQPYKNNNNMCCLFYNLINFLFPGISMHKGYAFVQFTNPFDARNACHGEDGRTVLSQILGKPIMSIKNNFFVLTTKARGK